MKILILVQSIHAGHYTKAIELQKNTWDSVDHPDVKTLFYTPEMGKSGIEGKDLYLNISPAGELMYVHFMKACVHALKFEWDYIFKTDNSTYVNKKVLVEVLKNKPRTKYYGGHPFFKTHPERNIPSNNPIDLPDFMWGDGFVLSRDVVTKLVEKYVLNPYYLRAPEDYCTAFVLRDMESDPTLMIPTYYDKDFSVLPAKHVYRCIPHLTNVDLEYEKYVHAITDIHKQFVDESVSVSNVV